MSDVNLSIVVFAIGQILGLLIIWIIEEIKKNG